MQLERCFPKGFSACFGILFVWSLLSVVAANNFGTRVCAFAVWYFQQGFGVYG
jgi:hypothetical protein